jgi:hypothetical protein
LYTLGFFIYSIIRSIWPSVSPHLPAMPVWTCSCNNGLLQYHERRAVSVYEISLLSDYSSGFGDGHGMKCHHVFTTNSCTGKSSCAFLSPAISSDL